MLVMAHCFRLAFIAFLIELDIIVVVLTAGSSKLKNGSLSLLWLSPLCLLDLVRQCIRGFFSCLPSVLLPQSLLRSLVVSPICW